MDSMLCFQCEQTAGGKGCSVTGVCGKTPEVAALQDLLFHACKAIAQYAHPLAQSGVRDREADQFLLQALFTTVTNVNFDPVRLQSLIEDAHALRNTLRNRLQAAGGRITNPSGPAAWSPAPSLVGLIEQGRSVGLLAQGQKTLDDINSLREILSYGLKGMAAYAWHAKVLGYEDDSVYAFMADALNTLATCSNAEQILAASMKCGEVNLTVMALLDKANTSTYGHPVPTPVRTTPLPGKAILVSGHDLKDLEELLKQTEGTGINVYTHGEMLPAHGYPGLKKYKHLAGNYGSAWQNQREEFDRFPGAILMTTNCIQKPRDTYHNRIFTSGNVAWPGVTHVSHHDFSPVIEAARSAPGFTETAEGKTLTVGFAHQAVLGVAGQVIDAVKAGKIRHFFLVGGCDGIKTSRHYYTDFATQMPSDCVLLTLGCGKYRFNHLEFGDIGGIPRLLDCGQCNDAYSAIKIAQALAEAFNCGVNDLPLSLVLSWYEQKAVCILLSLLYLGIRDIRLGPTLPAFISPGVLNVLVDQFGIKGITTARQDLEACLESELLPA